MEWRINAIVVTYSRHLFKSQMSFMRQLKPKIRWNSTCKRSRESVFFQLQIEVVSNKTPTPQTRFQEFLKKVTNFFFSKCFNQTKALLCHYENIFVNWGGEHLVIFYFDHRPVLLHSIGERESANDCKMPHPNLFLSYNDN